MTNKLNNKYPCQSSKGANQYNNINNEDDDGGNPGNQNMAHKSTEYQQQQQKQKRRTSSKQNWMKDQISKKHKEKYQQQPQQKKQSRLKEFRRRQFRPPVPSNQSEYLQLILTKVLHSDKWRNKLIRMCSTDGVSKIERIFPQNGEQKFAYVGSGSYAHVYRCNRSETPALSSPTSAQTQIDTPGAAAQSDSNVSSNAKIGATTMASSDKKNHNYHRHPHQQQHHRHHNRRQNQNARTSILKMIDVYSESVLKSFNGISARSSVSTYRDAYNEFKVSLYLSYLNAGLEIGKKYFKCCSFPDVYAIYVVDDSIPVYFGATSKIKQIDYGMLIAKRANNAAKDADANDDDDDENAAQNGNESTDTGAQQLRSRPSVRDLLATKPEIAIIAMEDCGKPIGDVLNRLRPMQILSFTKQLLLGFMIAEKAFEFEHRDLHLGNVMIKECEHETLSYLYCDKIIFLPSCRVQTKLIDTTFSRLKYHNKVFFRNLSHLFNEKDMNREANANNRFSHQDQAYRGMACEIGRDWSNHYERSNLVWSIYIIKKFLHSRPLRKETTRESCQVRKLLRTYCDELYEMRSMHQFFTAVYQKPELNRHVPIKWENI